MHRCLILDADCFTGPNKDLVLDWIESCEYDFNDIFLIGKDIRETKRWKELMDWWFPNGNVVVYRPRQGKDTTESWISFVLGNLLGKCECLPDIHREVVLLSTRSAVPNFVPILAERGTRVIVLSSTKSKLLGNNTPNVEIVEMQAPVISVPNTNPAARQIPDIPEWGRNQSVNMKPKIGFEIISVPSMQLHSSPRFIPFPETSPITIGKHAPSTICLEAWDVAKKGLYSPHVEIEFVPIPTSRWQLRSCHGHRTGSNGVSVNGKIVDAASLAVPLKNGDEVCIGGFRLSFMTDRFEELLRYEDPYQLVKDIELGLKRISETDKIKIRDLVDGEDMTGQAITSWKQVSWGQFDEIVTKLWDKPCFRAVQKHIESIDDLRQLLNKVKNARNTIGHPIRGDIKSIQKRHIVELHQLLNLSGSTFCRRDSTEDAR